ncbi:MAG: site-specific integrase [Tolypothrix brevis GSE-NOS-MK-07-07A]|jgi:integrase/recombinase XerD|nr:site-specific integrase [Tolypothrix brevis GSE-NOS-MK-07-07A]
MAKNNRQGQGYILSNLEYSKVRSHIKSQKYKLLLDLAWYTGERWGALVQLKISDCYFEGKPKAYINFAAETRKATPDGKHQARQVPTHQTLSEALSAYNPDSESIYMFPDRIGDKPITLRWADKILRTAVEKAGFAALGISTHSTRRSFITHLHGNGIDLFTIKQITGHKDFKTLERYVQISSDRVRGAIATL